MLQLLFNPFIQEGETAVNKAAKMCNSKVLEQLINPCIQEGETAVHKAAKMCNSKVLEKLIDYTNATATI